MLLITVSVLSLTDVLVPKLVCSASSTSAGLWAVYHAEDNFQWFLTIAPLWFECPNWLRVQNVEFAPVDLRMAMVFPPLLLSSELFGTAFVELKFHLVRHCLRIPLCFGFSTNL